MWKFCSNLQKKTCSYDEAVSDGTDLPENEFDMVEKLFEVSNAPVPAPLAALKDKKARFSDVTEVNSMPQYVLNALNIK